MRILFMHNNFPGQYRRIYKYLEQFKDYRMAVVTLKTNKQSFNLPRVDFALHREVKEDQHFALRSMEGAVLHGQAVYRALFDMKKRGERPDIILAHSGWGSPMFIKDIFPDAKLLTYYEWYYHCHGGDGEFFRDEPYGPNDEVRIRLKNAPILQDLAAMDWGQSPTWFQQSQMPDLFRSRISVLHDGVDCEFFSPEPTAVLEIAGKRFTADDEVITYIARGMEEYRGFPQFMEAVSRLQKIRPNLQTVVIGEDRIAYGSKRKDGKGLKSWALDTFDFDMNRLHFVGNQPLSKLRDALRITKAHIYLTAPFVLSWSMMESMATGALIVGSKTACVEEMITHGENGLLVDFFDVDALTDTVVSVLEHPNKYLSLKNAARNRILTSYSVNELLPRYRSLIETVASGGVPEVDGRKIVPVVA